MDNKESIFVDHRFIYGNRFPNPFFDIASTYLPRNIKQSFAWSEYLYFTNGILRAATERIVQYFITEVQYKGNSENTKRLKETLEKKLNIKSILTNIGIDYLVYGNSVTSIYFPFIRMLKCPNCKIELNADKVDYEYQDYKYIGKCLCGDKVTFESIDHKKQSDGDINIIRLDPNCLPDGSRYEVLKTSMGDSGMSAGERAGVSTSRYPLPVKNPRIPWMMAALIRAVSISIHIS